MSARPFMIDNAWRAGGDEAFASVNAAEDVDEAVAAPRAALQRPDWAALKPHERARGRQGMRIYMEPKGCSGT